VTPLKGFIDVFKEGSEIEECKRSGRLNLGNSLTQEVSNTIQGQVEILGDFSHDIVGSSSGPKHSGAVLRTEWGRIIIYLGPAWYFCQHGFPIRAGDILEINGSIIYSACQPIMLAKEVRSNGKKLRIRDEQGRPLWLKRK
jgi:hypothetical protein